MSKSEVQPPGATFELLNVALVDGVPEVLGLWAVVPELSDKISASASFPAGIDSPVWRASYKEDPGSAEVNLAMGEAKIGILKEALDTVPQRLNLFVKTQPAALDFGAPSRGGTSAKPEVELLAFLQEIRKTDAAVSYGIGEKFFSGWEQASHQFMTILDRVCGFVACYARVETRVEEQLLGQTAVSWTGDVITAWKAGLGPEQVRVHQRTLALALESRDTLLWTVLMSAQLAVKLSVLLGTPGGVILALPAVWRFIHQVLAEKSEFIK